MFNKRFFHNISKYTLLIMASFCWWFNGILKTIIFTYKFKQAIVGIFLLLHTHFFIRSNSQRMMASAFLNNLPWTTCMIYMCCSGGPERMIHKIPFKTSFLTQISDSITNFVDAKCRICKLNITLLTLQWSQVQGITFTIGRQL